MLTRANAGIIIFLESRISPNLAIETSVDDGSTTAIDKYRLLCRRTHRRQPTTIATMPMVCGHNNWQNFLTERSRPQRRLFLAILNRYVPLAPRTSSTRYLNCMVRPVQAAEKQFHARHDPIAALSVAF
jgi:hypothetical protein